MLRNSGRIFDQNAEAMHGATEQRRENLAPSISLNTGQVMRVLRWGKLRVSHDVSDSALGLTAERRRRNEMLRSAGNTLSCDRQKPVRW